MEYSKDLLPITDICLNVTEACNLQCVYCFTEHHPHYMTLDIAKDTAVWLYNNAKISSQIQEKEVIPNIGFFGGEPLLMWDSIIVPLIKWIRQEKKWNFTFGVTTNGTLLDKEKIDFLVNHRVGLLLSIDGDQKTQNLNRPCKNPAQTSFDLVSKNLKDIVQSFPPVTFRSTITAKTAPFLFHNLMYAGKMGFENVFSIINEFEEWSEKDRKIVEQEIDKYCLYVIDACIKQQNFVKLRPFEQALNKIIAIDSFHIFNNDPEKKDLYPDETHKCGLGSGYGSVNYKGEIFACQEVASREGEKDIFYIGNIYDDIDEEKLNNLRKTFLNRQTKYINNLNQNKCKNCISRMTCQANLCLVNNYILYKNFSMNCDNWCWWTNMMLEKAMNVIYILGINKNDYFKDYLLKEITMKGGPWYVNE